MQRSEQGRPLDFKMCGSITSPSKRHGVLQAREVDWLKVELVHKLNFFKSCPRGRRVLYFQSRIFIFRSILLSDPIVRTIALLSRILSSCKLFQNPFLYACRICLPCNLSPLSSTAFGPSIMSRIAVLVLLTATLCPLGLHGLRCAIRSLLKLPFYPIFLSMLSGS